MKFLFKASSEYRPITSTLICYLAFSDNWSLMEKNIVDITELETEVCRAVSAQEVTIGHSNSQVDIKAEICSDLRLTHTWQALNCLTHPCLARPPRSRSGLGLLGLGLGLLLKAEILLH